MQPDPPAPPLAAVLRRVAADPRAHASLVLRGGLVTRIWIAPARRRADDVDFLATFPHDHARTVALIHGALAQPVGDGAHVPLARWRDEAIWAETPNPGVRCSGPVRLGGVEHPVQLDVGFGDPLARDPQPLALLPGVTLPAVDPETLAAWKLHGLVERHDGTWRPKDLHDLWLLLTHARPDPAALRRSIALAFDSRDAPYRLLDRLLSDRLGRSGNSRRAWRRHLARHPERTHVELRDAVQQLAAQLAPVLTPLRAADPDPPPWAVIEDLDALIDAGGASPPFTLEQAGGLVLICSSHPHADPLPDPQRAATRAEHHRRLLLRESRGLAFSAVSRRLLSRMDPHWPTADPDRPPQPGWSWAQRLLDGTAIATLCSDGRLVWLTERGPDPRAERAAAFAEADPADRAGLIRAWSDTGHTVLWAWCAPEHRIVIRHDRAALVLTGIRALRTGRYLSPEALQQAAAAHGVPVVEAVPLSEPIAFLRRAQAKLLGAGWILRDPLGRGWVVRPDRYRLLHRIRWGPDPRPAALELFLAEGPRPLRALLDDRGAQPWIEAMEAGLGRLQAWIEARRGLTRADASQHTRGDDPLLRRALFRALDGHPDAIRSVLHAHLQRSGGLDEVRSLLGLEASL